MTAVDVHFRAGDLTHAIVNRGCRDQNVVDLSERLDYVRRLADVNKPGQEDKPTRVRRMAARRRKTLVVCQYCHHEIHRPRDGLA